MEQRLLEHNVVALRDGRRVCLRPLTPIDGPALLAFGRALPYDDDQPITDDWRNPEIINWLINATLLEHWRQLVATSGDIIVGYGAALRLPGWSDHVAEIYLIVSRGWRHAGLDAVLAPLLLDAARDLGATKAIVELLSQQPEQFIFERLGFRAEGTLKVRLHWDKQPEYLTMRLDPPIE
jgi:hypothetical protein